MGSLYSYDTLVPKIKIRTGLGLGGPTSWVTKLYYLSSAAGVYRSRYYGVLDQSFMEAHRRASLYMPAGRTALFNLERHGPAKTPYAFINSFLSEAGVSVVSFSGLSLFVLFCRRRFEPRRSSNPAAR